VYSKKYLVSVEKALANRKCRPVEYLANVRTRMVLEDEFYPIDPGLLSIFNINTPEDYEKACRIFEEAGGESHCEYRRIDQQQNNHLL